MATEKSVVEQEREVKDIIRRAKGNPDKTGAFRRETLRRLIDLTHSPHPTLKILAAGGIRYFFNDFPELEEAAINAVYDLCEDQSAKVRIEGYTAITQVSKTQTKWVKRNADVLLQLLQSDEPDEVIVVKKALTEHLDMDPRVTLGVLCDQIVPPEEPMEDEEQYIRDRLRTLVLAFLSGEAKRAIVERHASPGSDAEDVLVNGLLTAIPKLGSAETEIIVKDLLLALPSYKPNSPRGQALLQVLLEKATTSLRKDAQPSKPVSLETTRPYLSLAAFVVLEKRVAAPIDLLRFYCASLTGKMVLQRLRKDDQTLVISNMAETLAACDGQDVKIHDDPQLSTLRRQVVDACPILFERLADNGLSDTRSRNVCKILLMTCLRRKDESGWTVPPHLTSALNQILASSLCGSDGEQVQDVQNLIRSLVPTSNPKPALQQDSSPSTGISNNTETSKVVVKQNGDGRMSLPDRPLLSNPPSRRMLITSKPRGRNEPLASPLPSHGEAASISSSPTTAAAASKHAMVVDESSRPPKRLKKGGGGDASVVPSLLSRMGSSVSNDLNNRPNISLPPAKRPNAVQRASIDADIEMDKPPPGGYSIKGAAKVSSPRVESSSSLRLSSMMPPPASLLDRINGGGGGDVDGSSSLGGGDGALGGRKKKKRGSYNHRTDPSEHIHT